MHGEVKSEQLVILLIWPSGVLQSKGVKATFSQGFLNKQHGNNIQPENTAELQYTSYVPKVAASIFQVLRQLDQTGGMASMPVKWSKILKTLAVCWKKREELIFTYTQNQLRPQTEVSVLLFNLSKANCVLLKYQDEPFFGTELNRERLEGEIKGVICQKHNNVLNSLTLCHTTAVCLSPRYILWTS